MVAGAMTRGTSLELRCGTCRSNLSFPAHGSSRSELLGELYVSPNRVWMAWTGPYRSRLDWQRNRLPGPTDVDRTGSGTTWRPIPRGGVEHECLTGRHRMVLAEAELWALVRRLPEEAGVLFLPRTRMTVTR